MIPDIQQSEWKDLISGKNKNQVSSFSLQMKINSLQRKYRNGAISLEDAINDLHQLCKKYESIYKEDLEKIFNY